MSEYLQKLRELTDTLPSFPSLVKMESNNRIDYNVDNGVSFAFGLLSQTEVAVANVFISSGAVFPKHSHKENEFLIVYEGGLVVEICDAGGEDYRSIIVETGGSVYFDNNERHIVTALEDTWLIAITVPAAEGYPHE